MGCAGCARRKAKIKEVLNTALDKVKEIKIISVLKQNTTTKNKV